MSEKSNDIIYSAQDIEKYHRGLLSPSQMHAMEKAALDDPFLADAMEGYQAEGVHINADLAELRKRLADRLEDKKLVPLIPSRRSSFTWWRVAAMILAIAGAGLPLYQFLNTKDQPAKTIAMEPVPTSPAKEQPTVREAAPLKNTNEQYRSSDSPNNPSPARPENETAKQDDAIQTDKIVTGYATARKDTTHAVLSPVDNTAVPSPVLKETKPSEELALKKRKTVAEKDVADKTELAKRYGFDQGNDSTYTYEGNVAGVASQRSAAGAEQLNRSQGMFSRTNQFRGQVRDANNNVLPFANITNTRDNVGTYSDAQGRFILTSPDSVLNVQVRSLGFENSTQQLRNNVPNNEVVLQDDRKSLSEVVISNKKVNSSRARDANMILEEPEPADGWDNYDTYLANNLNVPESFKSRQTNTSNSEVELSFEVNKDGFPVNIKVVKSLCDKCDKEAIRLLKEGPKWKRKVKKGRTSVKIVF